VRKTDDRSRKKPCDVRSIRSFNGIKMFRLDLTRLAEFYIDFEPPRQLLCLPLLCSTLLYSVQINSATLNSTLLYFTLPSFTPFYSVYL
jgi:hypothetical protein